MNMPTHFTFPWRFLSVVCHVDSRMPPKVQIAIVSPHFDVSPLTYEKFSKRAQISRAQGDMIENIMPLGRCYTFGDSINRNECMSPTDLAVLDGSSRNAFHDGTELHTHYKKQFGFSVRNGIDHSTLKRVLTYFDLIALPVPSTMTKFGLGNSDIEFLEQCNLLRAFTADTTHIPTIGEEFFAIQSALWL